MILDVEGAVYGEKLGYANNYFGLGKGATHNTDCDFVKTGKWADHDGSEIDVTGKHVDLSIVKYKNPVSADILNKEEPEVLTSNTFDCNKSKMLGDVAGVEGADVEVVAIDHGIEGTYTLPEGYTPEGRLLNAKGGVVATMPGRIERIVDGKTETFKFSGGAPQNVKYTYEARVKKDTTITTIKTLEFILQGEN